MRRAMVNVVGIRRGPECVGTIPRGSHPLRSGLARTPGHSRVAARVTSNDLRSALHCVRGLPLGRSPPRLSPSKTVTRVLAERNSSSACSPRTILHTRSWKVLVTPGGLIAEVGADRKVMSGWSRSPPPTRSVWWDCADHARRGGTRTIGRNTSVD